MYTSNTFGKHLPQYAMRLRGLAEEFEQDIGHQAGFVAMQETRDDMEHCWSNSASGVSGPYKAGQCMAFHLRDRFPRRAETIHAFDHAPLATAVGPNWSQNSATVTEIGRDGEFPDTTGTDDRFVIETLATHYRTGWRVRLYNTHLSHNSGNEKGEITTDRGSRRLTQVQKIVALAKQRAQSGELLPIVVGDFNFHLTGTSNPPEAAELEIAKDFERVAISKVDQIWVGKKTSFPLASSGYVMREEIIIPVNAEHHVEFVFNGTNHAYHGQLSDHAALRVTLEVEE